MFERFRASRRRKEYWIPPKTCNSGRLHNYWLIDWCCIYYFAKNSLAALLEAPCAKFYDKPSFANKPWISEILDNLWNHIFCASNQNWSVSYTLSWLIFLCVCTCRQCVGVHVCNVLASTLFGCDVLVYTCVRGLLRWIIMAKGTWNKIVLELQPL